MSHELQPKELRPLSAEEFLIYANSSVLKSENYDEFDGMLKAVKDEVKPKGFIELMYVDEFSCLQWEILRMRRCKREIINKAIHKNLCWRLFKLCGGEYGSGQNLNEEGQELSDLAKGWFSDKNSKQKIAEIVGEWNFTDLEVEMAAINDVRYSFDPIDEMIAALERRRDRSLHQIAEYRDSFSGRMKRVAEKMIEGEVTRVPRLEGAAAEKSAA